MWQYVVKRLLYIIPIVLGVTLLVFIITRAIPGDPALLLLGSEFGSFTAEEYQEVLAYLGLDKPIWEQYLNFVSNMIQGDLGYSYYANRDVMGLILERLPATIELALVAMVMAVAISLPIGVIAASRQYSRVDYMSMFGALLGVSIPPFVLAIVFMYVFAVFPLQNGIELFPISGRGDLSNLVLPALTLGLILTASSSRLTRSSMLDVLRDDYVRTARAKGCTERKVIWWHTLRNALLPVVTNYGFEFSRLMVGALLIEIVFSWPGIGRLTYNSILTRDFPVVQGCVLFMALIFIFMNLIVDMMYAYIDPRIKYD